MSDRVDRAAHGHRRAPLRRTRASASAISPARAANAALADAGLDASEIDLVLVATLAPDEITPVDRAARRARARHRGSVAAIDVGAACAGSLAALAHATAWIEAGHARNVLVIGAEVLTRFIDFDDPRTAPLFADGAGALVVSRRRRRARSGRSCSAATAPPPRRSASRASRGVLEMEGHETFLMAVEKLSQSTREVLELAGARARGRRPVRLSPGQLAHPHGRRRAAVRCRASASSTASPGSATRAPPACRSRSARPLAPALWGRARGRARRRRRRTGVGRDRAHAGDTR